MINLYTLPGVAFNSPSLSVPLIKGYLEENNIQKKANTSNKVDKELDYIDVTTDKDLLDKLIEIRNDIASKERTLPAMVIPKNTLKEISGRYPQNKEQLLDISGFGPVKVEKYGDLILDTVVNHVKDNNIEVNFREKKRSKIIIDGDSRKNEEIAIDMLKENKSLEEIASYLEISISTILGYVTDYIKAGGEIDFELELDKYYDLEVAATIIDVCEEEGIDKISIIKKKLPDYIKYESIRAVILKKYYNI